MKKTEQMKIYKHSRIPLEMNTKSGDRVLIVGDTDTPSIILEALMANAYQMDLEPVLTIISPREYHQADPPSHLLAAMYVADLTLLCTSKAMLHSPECSKAMDAGRKFIAMEGLAPELLVSGRCEENYPKMQALAAKVREIFTKGKTIKVTSEGGTNLTANIEGRFGYVAAGKADKQEGVYLFAAAFPDGEVGIAPIEGTAQGTVVFDTTMHFFEKLRSPIIVKVKNGKATDIEGELAEELKGILEKYGDEYSYIFPSEIAVGLNSKGGVNGMIRTDKKLYGTVHMAFGMNIDIGGNTPGKLHLDGVIRYPEVRVDNELLVSKGKVLIN
jgi:2,5-dihydroxypyridine 5,6-dioxygenase